MIVRGKVKLIGDGTWNATMAGAVTRRSVVEIGDESIRNLNVSEYLESYLHVGDDVEANIVSLLGSKFLGNLRVGGKLYSDSLSRYVVIAIVFFVPALIFFSLISFLGTFALVVALAFAVPGFFSARSAWSINTYK